MSGTMVGGALGEHTRQGSGTRAEVKAHQFGTIDARHEPPHLTFPRP